MALQIYEHYESGDGQIGQNSDNEYNAVIYGDPATDNADDPLTIVRFAVQNISYQSAFNNVLNNLAWKRIAPGHWLISATYKNPTWERQTNDSCFSFTTGGGTQHITHSRATVSTYGNATDHQGSIGVSNNSVEGVDIHVPTFDFKTTFYPSAALVTSAYIASLKAMTNCVNSAVVTVEVDGVSQTFQPGELLFLGAEGSKRRGYSDWELTINWSSSRNVENLSIGPIDGISKRGWDYLWVEYESVSDEDANALAQRPKAVYVEQVYDYENLNAILLPTGYSATAAPDWTHI